MFSPMVSAPLTCGPSSPSWAGRYASYWATSAVVRFSNSSRSRAVHQSSRRPAPSYLEPWSSKP
ncbi:Uncharacterised protein [Mycobacteroides abscessus]|nr:Uncharacterised protein [Mycobacteroides abscessus]